MASANLGGNIVRIGVDRIISDVNGLILLKWGV